MKKKEEEKEDEGKLGTILICDDSVDLRVFLGLKLERAGYKVLQASNGKECIQILQRETSVNILILDIMMPEMNGIQTLHQLKLRLKKVKNKQAQEIEKHEEENKSVAMLAQAILGQQYVFLFFLWLLKVSNGHAAFSALCARAAP